MSLPFDPYRELQVSRTAEAEVIRAAYRALARVHHPDHSADTEAATAMARINAAWEILGDPGRRAEYDRGLDPGDAARGAASAATPGPAPAATSRRTSADPSRWRPGPDGEGAAGPPPGRPSGSVLDFGRHLGWSLGEIARVDPGYLSWLVQTRRGARYRDEVERFLGAARPATATKPGAKRPRSTWSRVLGR
ncbi:MAG: DnaJ domain-containing protein [Chloroflexi bacterium]|nr:DnaJ domain-containing protein [Chloroflexota bacterium]